MKRIIDAARGTNLSLDVDPTVDLLAGLNPEQRLAAEQLDGASLIAAVAGAGKTRVIVHRIANLVKNHGVSPDRILAVTFSKKGADEMNDRLVSMIGETEAQVSTFHSLAYKVVRRECPEFKDWTVDGKNRYRFCVKDACGFREMDWKGADISFLESFIGFAKNMLLRPNDPATLTLAQKWSMKKGKVNPRMMVSAYERAEELRIGKQLITFDDMIFECVELFQKNEPVRARWASNWDYVVQDEAQDQNLGQLLIGELLAKDHGNYQLVGDPAQCIYTWRGAQPEKLLGFEQKWGASVTLMGRNYRCGQVIIDLANKVLDSMDPTTRLAMSMVCEKGTEGELKVTEYQDLDDEGESIADRCLELKEVGTDWRDMAVLYRTNAQSRAVEESMIGNRIPYRIIGGTNFYERREVKQLLSYLRCAAGTGDLDDVTNCINAPFRFLGKAFVDKIRSTTKEARREARKAGVPVSYTDVVRETCNASRVQSRQRASAQEWADLIEDAHRRIEAAKAASPEDQETGDRGKPARILEDIVRLTRYTDWLTRDEGEESVENNRVSNVRELIRAAERFPTVDELLQYIEDTLKAAAEQRTEGTPNKVTLTTLHRSKGLEWTSVFLIGVNDDILPHAKAEDIEEERRLFYVGVTRAKENLTISCIREAAIGARVKVLHPSMFMREADVEITRLPSEGVDVPPGA